MKRENKLKVKILSFGFKYGLPTDVNFVWDVRFLPNPYWVEELRPRTGLEADVSDYVLGSGECQSFIQLFKPLFLYIIQQNIVAEKKEVHVAIGCTGGRHRSVAVVEVLKDILRMMPVDLEIEHRDIAKDGKKS